MKRLIAGGAILLLVSIGLFLWRQNQNPVSSSRIAPADCLVYIEMPDLIRTAKRWPDTALSQILAETSVQRFLARPLSKAPKSYQSAWASIRMLRCSALFLSVTDANCESWICGFQTSVDPKIWRKEMSNIGGSLFGQAVREVAADHLSQAGSRSSDSGNASLTCVQVGSWILLSRSTDLLLNASRNAKTAAGGLQAAKLFQDCRSNVKGDYDFLCFVRGRPSLELSNGLRWRFREDEARDSARAILATTAIEGTRLRDTIFTRTDAPAPSIQLDRKGLAMTSPSTIGYLASRVNLSEIWRWTDRLSDESSVAKTIRDYMGEVNSFGMDLHELDALLSHFEVIVDRDPDADFLNAAFSIGVTDPEKLRHLIDQIVMERLPERSSKTEVASVPVYVVQLNGNISIVAGIVGRQLLVAWSRSEFAELVHRLQSHSAGLENNAQFKAMSKLVNEPDDLFVYFDAKTGFESLYDASRTMLVFGVALIPLLNKYIDAMAFPETNEISRHLGPMVFSRHRVPRGVLDESVGPVTAYEALVLVSGGAVAMGLLGR